MSFRKSLFVITGFFLFSSAVFSQENKVLNLSVEDAVELALKENISIKQSNLLLDSSKRSKDTSWNSLLPSVTASGTYNDGLKENAQTVSLGIRASLAINAAMVEAIKATRLNYEKAKIDYDNAVRTIELNIRKTYYNLLVLQETVSIRQNYERTSKQQYESNVAKYKLGAVSNIDLLSSQVSFQQATLDTISTRDAFNSGLSQFKQLLGLSQSEELKLTDSISDFVSTKNLSIDGIQGQNAKLKSLESQLAVANANLLTTRLKTWTPTISAQYGFDYTGLSATDYDFKDSNSVTLSISLPLDSFLPFSQSGQSIANAKDNVKNIELQIEQAKASYEIEIADCLTKINRSKDNLKLCEENIVLSEKTYNFAKDAYDHGTRDLLTLQNYLDRFNTSKFNLMQEQYSLICAVLDLENILGVPFGTFYGRGE